MMASCQYTDLRAILINNKASKTIKEKSIDETQGSYLKALELEPLLPAVHSNLGSTYDVLKDPDKAMKLYKNAEEFTKSELDKKHQDPLTGPWELNSLYTTLFASQFNQGQLLARENKIDEALEKYQAALEINPNSVEVKTNIELLFQKQQGQGQGEGDSKSKDPNKDDKGKDPNKDPKDDEKEGNQPKNFTSSPKYKPRDFKGDLTKENVQKIFGEISQQEKKMRAQFSKQNQTKEAPREKDW
jgi:tetratricopeptide (TPR) repeat protein